MINKSRLKNFEIFLMGPVKTNIYVGIENLYRTNEMETFLKKLNDTDASNYDWKPETREAGDPQAEESVVRRFAIAEKIISLNDPKEITYENKTIRCNFREVRLRIHYIATMIVTFKVELFFEDFEDSQDFSETILLQKLEKELTDIIKADYTGKIIEHIEEFRNAIEGRKIKTIVDFEKKNTTEDAPNALKKDKEDGPGIFTWIHTLFGFNFKEQTDNKDEIAQKLATVVKQKPVNMNDIKDRYVFLGWFRSIFLSDDIDWPDTNKSNLDERLFDSEKRPTINEVARIIQYTQYLYHSLLLIDKHLFREFITEKQEKKQQNLDKKINRLGNLRNRINKFLDQFSFSPNISWNAEAKILFEKLKDIWRLPEYGNAIKSMLEQIDQELKDMQDEARRRREDRLNNLVIFFTFLTLTTVIIELWLLQETGIPDLQNEDFRLNLIYVLSGTAIGSLVLILIFKVLPEKILVNR